MLISPLENLLVTDALQQLIMFPQEQHLWRALRQRFDEDPSSPSRTHIIQTLEQQLPAEGMPGFYRATLLDALCPGQQWDAVAADLLLRQPPDASRAMVYCNLQWALAVRDCANHQRFHARLAQAGLPPLLRHLGSGLPKPPSARRSGAVRRLALVVPSLGNERHPPTLMALEQLKLLSALGVEVALFSCQEQEIADADRYLGCSRSGGVAALDIGWLAQQLPPGVVANISDVRLAVATRWRGQLSMIADYAPDLVMFVGLMSPMVFALYSSYPVLGLGVHAVAPIAPVDCWLSADAGLSGISSRSWGQALPPATAVYHPYRIRYQVAQNVPRSEFGLHDDQLVWITVGARLTEEIAGAWAERMLAVLADDERIVWVLVGGAGNVPPALAGVAAGRLHCIAHTDELNRLLSVSDIYVNPPRMGGGLSVGEAMAQGVPVVALVAGDAGAKLGDAAQPDSAHYFRQLQRLCEDPVLRRRTGLEQQQYFAATLDLSQSGASLLAAVEQSMQCYRRRVTA